MKEQTSPLHELSSTAQTAQQTRLVPSVSLSAFTGDLARTATLLALAAIIVLGAYLRLTHVNWDDNGHLHPDERFLTQIETGLQAPSSIANYFDTDDSRLNPYNIPTGQGGTQSTFVYGTLPIFVNKFVASNLSWISLGYFDDYDDYDHYNRSGRALSALFDLGTLVVVFLLGRELLNRYAGLLGAFLYAVSAFPIQNSHFFIVDPYVTFFATLTIYLAVRSARHGKWRDFALAGGSAGLAAACKITAVSLLPVVLLAIGVYAWPGVKPYLAPLWYGNRPEYRRMQDGRALDRAVVTMVVGALVALVAAMVGLDEQRRIYAAAVEQRYRFFSYGDAMLIE